MRTIERIIVHCSDTPSSMDIGAKEINIWHSNRGWNGIGYHYVIRRDGTIEVGRTEERVGAHCRGYNSTSIGVCLIGRNNSFTNAQLNSLRRLCVSCRVRYGDLDIEGHYKYNEHKTCPDFDVTDWVAEVGL